MNVRLLIGLMLSLLALTRGGEAPGLADRLLWLAAILAAVAAWGLLVRRWVAAMARRGDPPEVLFRRHGRMQALYDLLWLAAYAAFLFLGRWPDTVAAAWQTESLLVDRLLVLAPMLAIFMVASWGSFQSTAVLRTALAAQGYPQPGGDLSFRHYFGFQVRQQVLILLAYYVFVLGSRDVAVMAAGPLAGDPAILLAVLLVYTFSPLVLRVFWPTDRLPEGPLRDRLLRAAERAGTRVSDVFVWRTGGVMVNACVAGAMVPLRYVFLTDSLVRQLHPAQVEAVFAHELGHARFHHLPFYFLLAVGGVVVLLLAAPPLLWTGLPEEAVVLLVLLPYWGLFFGWLSRRFERQSDLHGARLVLCPGEKDPMACAVHRPGAPADAEVICPYQAWAFTSALSRIAMLNGVGAGTRSWRHGSIARRIEFISAMIGRPEAIRRYDRRLWTIKLAFFLVVMALGVLAVAAYWWWRWGPLIAGPGT